MANHCWNHIEIKGSKESISSLKNLIESHKYNLYEAIRNLTGDKDKDFDSRWFDAEIEFSPEGIIIFGDSAWSPPLKLSEIISKEFKTSVKHEYSEEGNDFAGFEEYRDGILIDYIDLGYKEYMIYNEDYEGFYQSIGEEFNCLDTSEVLDLISQYSQSIEMSLNIILVSNGLCATI